MKYIKINTIQNVDEFSFIEKNIFLIKNNKLFLSNILIKEGDFSFFGIYNKQQLVFDEDNFHTLIYSSKGKLITKIEEYALRHIFTFNNGNSLVGGNDGKTTFYGIYNFTKNKMIKRYDNLGLNGIYQVLNDNLFLSQNNEKFGVFNFDNTCIWQHNYSDLFGSNYKGITPTNLINIKEKLYVCFGRTTFCIDIETGNIEHTYKDYFSVAENEFLYGLKPTDKRTNFYITILNTTTQKIERIDILDELKKHNIYTDQNFAVQNGLIYFKQSMGADVARIGILDPKTAKLIWKYDLPKGSGQVGSIQVQGDRIYVHTQDKTLHIFEKQKNTIA